MPKPMIDESDPRLPILNEILADFITKNLRKIPGKRLMFVDVICLLLSPLTIVITLFRDLYIFLPLLLSGLFLSTNYELVSTIYVILIVVLLTSVFSQKLRTELSRTIFHVFNVLTGGYLIRIIAHGYQTNEPISHAILKDKSPIFGLLGNYVETLDSESRSMYHKYIDTYQESRYLDNKSFEEMIDKYWSDNKK